MQHQTQKTLAVIVTLLVIHDGKVLLAKRTPQETRAPEDEGKLWHLPGGTLEYSEHPEQTAVREAAEELGLSVRIHRLVGVATRTKSSHHWHGIILTYLCTLFNPHDVPTLKADELTDYDWLNYEDLDDAKLLPGTRDQVDMYYKSHLLP